MPHAIARLHPLEAALRDLTALSGRVFVGESTLQHGRQGRDTRVRVNTEELSPGVRHFGVIEKHERLDALADIGRTDQTRHRTMTAAGGAQHDATLARLEHGL